MYLIPITVKKSEIEGNGVFALNDILKGTLTWKYDPAHDRIMTQAEFNSLSTEGQNALLRVAYLSPSTKRWVFPPDNDPSLFTNHSRENNQSVVFNASISEEPFFRANRNISKGEELTVNYAEFDARPKNKLEKWV